MTSIAQAHPHLVGVDTHSRSHVYTLIDPVGTILGARRFPAAGAGMARAIGWIGASTGRDMRVLWVVEGCASYGAALAVIVYHRFVLCVVITGIGQSDCLI
ncbi:MAG: transposase [Bifidobacterium tibiigranuli]|jgi:hypothetical protein|uniref:IS110 family transposase n=1 Tax=Bifidobacterium tibiigranuli TaxID=2172043 RepID=UPI0026EB114D|nr:transposase [Bifidobacterium tibiigranuli]MCI1673743.1 transposase [Bifidobacterium tibiigranuli]MCI1711992.1 transposase [Bifidobacterium tibiigranuli]